MEEDEGEEEKGIGTRGGHREGYSGSRQQMDEDERRETRESGSFWEGEG